MLLYLDNSVLNRPFDDQRQPRVWLETLSFSLTLTLIESGEATLVRSPIHNLENDRNPFPLRQQWVEKCLRWAAITISFDSAIKTRAQFHEQNGLKPLDALHLASAESAATDRFLTCDDRLIRRYSGQMVVQNPITFITSLA